MPPQAELDPVQRQTMEQPNIGARIAERIGTMAAGAKEAVSGAINSMTSPMERQAAVLGIGFVGLSSGGNIGEQPNTEPARASGTGVEAISSGNLRENCVRAALRLPKPLRGIVSRPGDRKKQNIYSDAYHWPIPDPCDGIYRRVPLGKLQIQNPRNHRRWFNLIPYSAPELTNPDPDAKTFRVGNEGGKARISYFPFPFEIRDNRKRYRCTPGKGVTHVRALYRNLVREVSSGDIIARSRVRNVPIKVRPIKPGTNYRGAVNRAC